MPEDNAEALGWVPENLKLNQLERYLEGPSFRDSQDVGLQAVRNAYLREIDNPYQTLIQQTSQKEASKCWVEEHP